MRSRRFESLLDGRAGLPGRPRQLARRRTCCIRPRACAAPLRVCGTRGRNRWPQTSSGESNTRATAATARGRTGRACRRAAHPPTAGRRRSATGPASASTWSGLNRARCRRRSPVPDSRYSLVCLRERDGPFVTRARRTAQTRSCTKTAARWGGRRARPADPGRGGPVLRPTAPLRDSAYGQNCSRGRNRGPCGLVVSAKPALPVSPVCRRLCHGSAPMVS